MPHSADQDIWYRAISTQAEAAGLKLGLGDTVPPGADLMLGQNINVAMAAGAKAEDIAVLLSQAGPLAPEYAGPEANPLRHPYVINSTAQLERAMKAAPERRFTASQLAKTPVALFPNFTLHIPDAVPQNLTRRNRAVVEAQAIYERDSLVWSPDVLDIYAPILGRQAHSLTLDATGKPRFLVHGPYITLPAGNWKMVIKIEVEQALCNKAYVVHWGGMTEYSILNFRPSQEGLYEIEMDWTWETAAPGEFRIIASEGIFDGLMTLHDLQLSRIG